MSEPDPEKSEPASSSSASSQITRTSADLIIRPLEQDDMDTVARLVSEEMVKHLYRNVYTFIKTLHDAVVTDLKAYFDEGDPAGFSGYVAELTEAGFDKESTQVMSGTGVVSSGRTDMITHVEREIIGYLGCQTDRRPIDELAGTSFSKGIKDFCVRPDHRRKGVGTALLKAYINHIEERGKVCSLGVSVHSGEQYEEWAEADGFFEQQGFELINDDMFDRRRVKRIQLQNADLIGI